MRNHRQGQATRQQRELFSAPHETSVQAKLAKENLHG